MISKEEFVAHINRIKKWHEKQDKFNSLGIDFGEAFDEVEWLEQSVVDLLKDEMNDSLNLINYFIYDMDFLPFEEKINGVEYSIKDEYELWEVLYKESQLYK